MCRIPVKELPKQWCDKKILTKEVLNVRFKRKNGNDIE